ncbi:hypothetical protein C9439_00545 [archaeon SCG-AAA382B04]|nr:hypothetical protein C9439_00545 [archaeon SCG-AAA382B04]
MEPPSSPNEYEVRKGRRSHKPLLIGVSRKSLINDVSEKKLPTKKRLWGSIAAEAIAIANGADILRVHDVEETKRAIEVTDSIINH